MGLYRESPSRPGALLQKQSLAAFSVRGVFKPGLLEGKAAPMAGVYRRGAA